MKTIVPDSIADLPHVKEMNLMRVLFAPLGLAYGSLYSAILLTKPDRVVVITSQQAAVNVDTAFL